jgi:hypothetical protein
MSEKDIFSRWTDIISKIMAQITSGRWIITVVASYCLIKLTDTLCQLIADGKITLEAATYVAIIMAVLNTIGTIVMYYFNKNRDTQNGENGNGDTTTTTTTLK